MSAEDQYPYPFPYQNKSDSFDFEFELQLVYNKCYQFTINLNMRSFPKIIDDIPFVMGHITLPLSDAANTVEIDLEKVSWHMCLSEQSTQFYYSMASPKVSTRATSPDFDISAFEETIKQFLDRAGNQFDVCVRDMNST